MDTHITPCHPNRTYKFGRHWSENFPGVSCEVSRERAMQQHQEGEGYTVLIIENVKPKYVVVIGPNLQHVTFLDDVGKSILSLQFIPLNTGQLFMTRANPRPKGVIDKQTRRVIGEHFNFVFSPDGNVTVYRKVVPSGQVKDIETWVAQTRCNPSGLWEKTPPFGEFDPLLKQDRVDLDALVAQIRPEDWVRQGPPSAPAKAYDKAAYHEEAVAKLKLPPEHAENQTLFFLRWLIENNLMRQWYMDAAAETLEECRAGKATIRDVYRQMASALMSDMLSPEAEAFVKDYYFVSKSRPVGYPRDFSTVLQGNLPSSYHVPYTENNYQRIKPVLDQRFREWRTQP